MITTANQAADLTVLRAMSELAWFAANRAGLTGLDLPGWRDQVDVEFGKYDDEDAEAGPTQPTP